VPSGQIPGQGDQKGKKLCINFDQKKTVWATLWAILSQTRLTKNGMGRICLHVGNLHTPLYQGPILRLLAL
jgi:urease accessory protein UreE